MLLRQDVVYKKSVVIVVQTHLRESEISLIHNMGYQIVYIKQNIDMDELIAIDFPYEVEQSNVEEVINLTKQLCEKFDVRRIFTLNEYYIPVVAQLAEECHIKYWGLKLEAAENCRHKIRAKEKFKENNTPSAKYVVIKSVREVLSVINQIEFPIVVKPSNESGSKSVFICKDMQELIDAVECIEHTGSNFIGQKLDEEIIVEEYLEGLEYSVESYTINNVHTIVAITSKKTFDCIEIGHMVPAILDKTEREAIETITKAALTALDIDYGVTHTEIKLTIDGPKVIEVNGRPGGDHIDELVRAVTGLAMREIALSIAMRGNLEDNQVYPISANSAAIAYAIANKSGVVQINDNEISEKNIEDVSLTVENGEYVERTTNNFNRLGYVIAYDEENARKIAEEYIEKLQIQIV
nr:ATP-grasp domain-containing protein [uncultured Cellulosilyticum sp.]